MAPASAKSNPIETTNAAFPSKLLPLQTLRAPPIRLYTYDRKVLKVDARQAADAHRRKFAGR